MYIKEGRRKEGRIEIGNGIFFILRKIIDIMISHLENFELKNAKISIKAQFLSSASEWKRQKNIIQLEGTRTADLQKLQTFFFFRM